MKTIIMLLMAAFSILTLPGFSQEKAGKKDTTSHISYYACPMHDSVKATKAGHCPICGMKLQLSGKEQMKSDVVKNYTCPLHPEITSNSAGKCSKCGSSLALSGKEQMKAGVTKNFTCPMHGDVASDKPGKCSKCGMDLVSKKN